MPATTTTSDITKKIRKAITRYYDNLKQLSLFTSGNEGGLRHAFQTLLADTAKLYGRTAAAEQSLTVRGKLIRPDGVIYDAFKLPRGYWEAKDAADDLDAEIRAKAGKGYPLGNTIFENTQIAVLYQNGHEAMRLPVSDAARLEELLRRFFDYAPPDIERFDEAVVEFKDRIPDLARGLRGEIDQAHKLNPKFQAAFGAFYELCRQSLNPNISRDAVDEMLVQHLMTERLIREIFDNPDFAQKNAIAAEIEKVIRALVSQSFSRTAFFQSSDYFYKAIAGAARGLEDFGQKQTFLNSVWELFFQKYATGQADVLGIVYTPQEIVEFMVASVEEVLRAEFGRRLGDPEVYLIDPCTGTGSFVVHILRHVAAHSRHDLERVYSQQLFANEISLMAYYTAALNVEHTYQGLTGKYEPFEGLCFVDTLDLSQSPQLNMFAEENTERVSREVAAPITVVLGNPPYNMHQQNENDNNKNRKYKHIDERVQATYTKDSQASNRNALSDPFVKFFRWATDRLDGRDGIVCFVSNNGFVDQIAFDGMRKHLLRDFTRVYHLDLHGNVRRNPKLSGTTHNVFGIQVGVGITVAVRSAQHADPRLYYYRVPEDWRKEEKLDWLGQRETLNGVEWRELTPDSKGNWLIAENADEYATFLPLGSKSAKAGKTGSEETIFRLYSNGVKTNRDDVVYDFRQDVLAQRVEHFIEEYNAEVDRYRRSGAGTKLDDFVRYDKVKWSEGLKAALGRGQYAQHDKTHIREAVYRPFTKRWLYFDDLLNERRYQLPWIFPQRVIGSDNRVIWLKVGSDWPMFALMVNCVPDLLPQGGSQCFPFYTYDEDGGKRRENVTDWALGHFREHYGDDSIGKWDVFYYVYGLLHHPGYRQRYAAALKRELPRIPFAGEGGFEPGEGVGTRNDAEGRESTRKGSAQGEPSGAVDPLSRPFVPLSRPFVVQPLSGPEPPAAAAPFWAFARAGRELARLHLEYETLEPWPLTWVEDHDRPLSYRVERLRLSPDRSAVIVNPSLTLAGIPPETFDYRLGNRSALEWVIDQYALKTDERSGITSDPNRPDDPEYIVRLIGQVVRVSVETVRVVESLNHG